MQVTYLHISYISLDLLLYCHLSRLTGITEYSDLTSFYDNIIFYIACINQQNEGLAFNFVRLQQTKLKTFTCVLENSVGLIKIHEHAMLLHFHHSLYQTCIKLHHIRLPFQPIVYTVLSDTFIEKVLLHFSFSCCTEIPQSSQLHFIM